MPPTNTVEGLEAAERMRAEDSTLGVMFLSQDVDPHTARRLLAVGQQGLGYLLKDHVTNIREFSDAIRRVAAAFEVTVIASIVGGDSTTAGNGELTDEERQGASSVCNPKATVRARVAARR
jgi:DNA-binding NarL/FixJ family response regulator